MLANFDQPGSWVSGLAFAIVFPWLILQACQWIILRCGEERLQAIPYSVWQPLYKRLLKQSSEALFKLSEFLPRSELYLAMNPERCNQQTLKVLLPYTEALTDQLIRPLSPIIWDNMPQALRTPIYQRVTTKFKPCIDRLVVQLEKIVTEHFNHAQFIQSQLEHQETGYRFIVTEALHQYWHILYKKSRNIGLLLVILWLLIGVIWPPFSSGLVLILMPCIATFIASLLINPMNGFNQRAFARCLGYWLGERIYLLDAFVQNMRDGGCDSAKLYGIINRAFQPLIEDTPLKTLAQVALGRQAPLDIRSNLINYIIANASTPFEHTQFKHERALEVSQAYEEAFMRTPPAQLFEAQLPLHQTTQRLVWLVITGFCALIAILYWYFM